MEATEFEERLTDLETRIARLRALYEQYFQGIERLEPSVPRKEVERILAMLKKERPRNTALRFRYQTLVQRWTTFTTHWQRITRQMEEGTFKRDLAKVKRKKEAEAKRKVAKEVELDETDLMFEDLIADVEELPDEQTRPTSRPPPKVEPLAARAPALALELDLDDAPAAAPAAPLSGRPAPRRSLSPFASVPKRSVPPASGNFELPPDPRAAPSPAMPKAQPAARVAMPMPQAKPSQPIAQAAPQPAGSPPMRTFGVPKGGVVSTLEEEPRTAAIPRPGGPQSKGTVQMPGTAPIPKPAPSTATLPRTPEPAARVDLGARPPATKPEGPPTSPFVAPTAPKGYVPPRPPPGTARIERPADPPRVAPPAPKPAPIAARPAPRAEPDDAEMKRLYDRYIQARRKNNEPDVSFDTVKNSLSAMAPKLREKHRDGFGFEVVMKDGRVAFKPVSKK